MTKEEVMLLIEDMYNDTVIELWNECVDDIHRPGDKVYRNDREFFDTVFRSPYDAILAVVNGDWNEPEEYAALDNEENVVSFDWFDEETSPIDMDILADWLLENPDKAAEYGIEEDE